MMICCVNSNACTKERRHYQHSAPECAATDMYYNLMGTIIYLLYGLQDSNSVILFINKNALFFSSDQELG